MSIVIRTQSGTAESSTLRPDQPEEVLNVESFRVLSEVADRLGAWLLLDFADTLRELGADRAGVRRFRLVVDSSPERGPYRLVAEWENDLQMPHAPAETELGRLRAELAEVKRERDTGREALAEEEVSASDTSASEPECGGGLCMAPTRCTLNQHCQYPHRDQVLEAIRDAEPSQEDVTDDELADVEARVALTVAFNAGRESVFDGGVVEWAARCTSVGHDHESDAGVFFVRVGQERDRVERYIAAADLPFELVTRRRAELVEPWQVISDVD